MTIEQPVEPGAETGVERRTLLKAGLASAAVAGPFTGLTVPAEAGGRGRPRPTQLFPVEDKRDGVVRLHLPRGFQYRSFHDTSQPVVLDDGTVLPPNHDGMGAFRDRRGGVLLVRNHELNNPSAPADYQHFGPAGDHTYDPAARGGTTTIHVDRRGRVDRAYTSLNGTIMNCSGGIMPWGSWITCEETVNGPDVGPDFTGASNEPLQEQHGYVFEVPAGGRSKGTPIRSAGRFAHEAVSFDPREGRLYLTEDNFGFPSGFFRYTPPVHPMKAGRMKDGGRLEMLAVVGEDGAHLEREHTHGMKYRVRWVPIADPDFTGDYDPATGTGTTNDDAIRYVGDQGRALGAAHFSRLEGQVYDDGVVYFCSTQGGGPAESVDPADLPTGGFGNGHGQVWAYDTRRKTLTCVYQSTDVDVLDLPDNITASKRGTLVLCEDHDDDNYLRGLSRRGRIWDIAVNRINGMFDAEFAGSTFSADGKTLFVNIQDDPAVSFAVWGPWRAIGV
jgi:uncharacterized protein